MSTSNLFFHVDLDAFYSSVEQLDNPEYKGKPVIVGGISRRGVVSTCSYEARKYGVHSAMPIRTARSLCPNGIFLAGRMKRYHEKSIEVMRILKSYTPEFQQLSIDEAFLNMSGMHKLMGEPEKIAKNLKAEVYEKTGLTISVGVASTKYIAKIASDKSKPDGLLIINPEIQKKFIQQLALKEIWGIGKKTIQKLENAGLYKIDQILKVDLSLLQTIIGNAAGLFLYNIINGNTEKVFNETKHSHSISTERTFSYDIFETEQINDILFEMASELIYRIVDEKLKAKTVSVKIRYSDFKTVSAQETGDMINDTFDLYKRAKKIFHQKNSAKKPVRLIGISVLNVKDDTKSQQNELFVDKQSEKKRLMEETMFNLSKKAGKTILKRARLIKPENKQ
ncbi:MAG: DNA polymerase IV [Treponema sp.]|nr:MAG: DNA polymerase IV [Treponema sp.]